MAENADIKLVESTLAGDVESFGTLCGRYYSSMAAIAYSALSDHQLAEDVVQETFAQALLNLNKLKQKEKFPAWLARICRNIAADMSKVRLREFSSDDDFDSMTKVPAGGKNTSEIVTQAISKLSSFDRELVVLRFYDNLSYEQISAVLGKTPAAINGKLVRAKKKLAQILRKEGFPEVEL